MSTNRSSSRSSTPAAGDSLDEDSVGAVVAAAMAAAGETDSFQGSDKGSHSDGDYPSALEELAQSVKDAEGVNAEDGEGLREETESDQKTRTVEESDEDASIEMNENVTRCEPLPVQETQQFDSDSTDRESGDKTEGKGTRRLLCPRLEHASLPTENDLSYEEAVGVYQEALVNEDSGRTLPDQHEVHADGPVAEEAFKKKKLCRFGILKGFDTNERDLTAYSSIVGHSGRLIDLLEKEMKAKVSLRLIVSDHHVLQTHC